MIGRSITVDGLPHTIVGVFPRGVTVPRQSNTAQSKDPLDVLLPLDLASAPPASIIMDAFARLRPGVTSAAASRELEAILRTLPDTASWKELHAVALTPPEQMDPRRRRGVEVLFAAAAGLLLIGCADVAGLLLMRGWARRREFAIRRALGAGRDRLARQLLMESLLLAAPSGALGLLVAWPGPQQAWLAAHAAEYANAFLPGYVPEVNPAEQCRRHAKHALLNVPPRDVDEQLAQARREFRRLGRRPDLLARFFADAGLRVT